MTNPPKPKRPLVGVTADIDWRTDVQPPRTHYELDAHVTRALHEAGATVVIVPHDDDDVAGWCERLDGLVVSGGAWVFPRPKLIDEHTIEPRHKVRRARFEIDLVSAALRRDLPLLGICGGFQVLHRVLGGDLTVDLTEANPAWSIHAGADRAHVVHQVTPQPGTLLAAIVGGQPFMVNSQHRQGVTEVARSVRVAARSDDGLIEAIEAPDVQFCMGVQWHPEFALSAQDRSLMLHFVRSCSEVSALPSVR